MKIITASAYTKVMATDDSDKGGIHHNYGCSRAIDAVVETYEFGYVKFQKNPISNVGVNGCTNEDLLEIVKHRLQCFQAGTHSCRENALALTKIEEAIHWLEARTAEREKRGVEGTNEI